MNQSNVVLSPSSPSTTKIQQRMQYASRTPENERVERTSNSLDLRRDSTGSQLQLQLGKDDSHKGSDRDKSVSSEDEELLPRLETPTTAEGYNHVHTSTSSLTLATYSNGFASGDEPGQLKSHHELDDGQLNIKKEGSRSTGARSSRRTQKASVNKDRERTKKFAKEMAFVVRNSIYFS